MEYLFWKFYRGGKMMRIRLSKLWIFICLVFFFSPLEGNLIRDDYIVNDDTLFGRPQRKPAVDRNSSGMTVVVFEDDRNWYESMSDVYGQILDSLGNTVGFNFLCNGYTDENQGNPDVALTPTGRFIVVFEDERNGDKDIYGRIFLPTGEPIGPDFRINDDPQGEIQRNPRVEFAVDRFVVIFEDTREGESRIYAQFIDTTGNFIGSNRLIVSAPELTNQTEPDVVSDTSGKILIVWKDDRDASSHGYDIFAGIWSYEGNPLVSSFRINDDTGLANQESPGAASLDGTGFFVVFEDERDGDPNIYAQIIDTSGNLIGSNFRVNDETMGLQGDPSVSASDSYVLVSFTDFRTGEADIYAQFFDFFGNTQGTNFRVNDNLSEEQKDSRVAYGSGRWIVVFSDSRSGEPDIYAQMYYSSGSPLNNNFTVVYEQTEHSMYWQSKPSVAITYEGNYSVVFYDDRNMDLTGGPSIYIQNYNSSGIPLGGNIQVEDTVGFLRDNPAVALTPNGKKLVVFEDTREGISYIFGQLYDEDGNPSGNFRIGEPTGFGQYMPSVEFSPIGYFVVVWQDLRGGDHDIYGQFVSSDGSLYGSNFPIETGDPGVNQITPDVSVDGMGRIFVVFSDDRNYSQTYYDVYGIFLNPDGSPIGPSFKINDDNTFEIQVNPRCAQSQLGHAVAVWVDYRDYDTRGSDIYGQLFDDGGNPLGGNFRVNDDETFEMQREPDVAMDDIGGFVVVFSDERNGGQPDIYAQVYSPDGVPEDSNFVVSQDSPLEIEQNTPRVALSHNRLVIVWQAFPDPDVSNWNPDIFAELSEWTPPTKIVEESGYLTNFGVYPNPLGKEGFLLFYLKKSENVEAKLYDVAGRLRERRILGKLSPGIYRIPINLGHLRNGVYFLELVAGDERGRRRILVLK
jgi:hypothetical protein